MLIKPATCQSEVVCLFPQSLLALCVQGPVSDFTRETLQVLNGFFVTEGENRAFAAFLTIDCSIFKDIFYEDKPIIQPLDGQMSTMSEGISAVRFVTSNPNYATY